MAGTSKNARENKGVGAKNICGTCGQERKAVLVMKGFSKRMCGECKCGRYDKNGIEF